MLKWPQSKVAGWWWMADQLCPITKIGDWDLEEFGGGGGSRTRVRKPSDLGSTCLARSIFSYQQAARGAGHTW